jgi:hypothetical protein
MNPDPGPSIFVINFQDANKKLFNKGSLLIIFEGTFYIIFQRLKVKKKSQNSRRNQGFLTLFA